jgi:paraquat-inducible protein A
VTILTYHECGITNEISSLQAGEQATCHRCSHLLLSVDMAPIQGPIRYALATLIALLASISYPFMSFSVQGLSQEITRIQSQQQTQISLSTNSDKGSLVCL